MDADIALPDLLAVRTDTIRSRSAMQARGIVDDVNASIGSGALRPGDRLPDERSLCQRYAAGRHTVRKAMETLEREGLIGRFVGRGSFVLDRAAAQPAPSPAPPRTWTLIELTEARFILEPGVAMLAAERRTPTDLARLDRCLTQIARSESWRSFKEAKYAFHRMIAQIAGNDFVCNIFDQIITSRRQAWEGYRLRVQDLAGARAVCLEECRAILGAITGSDADQAAETVRRSITRLLDSLNAS